MDVLSDSQHTCFCTFFLSEFLSFSLGFEYLTGDELGGTSGKEAGLPMQET